MNTKVAKKNNKGFTLIELIVVIAIIAVLAAILAPQYLRYVEKSRISVDCQAAAEILGAARTASADETVYDEVKSGATLTWESDGTIQSAKTNLLSEVTSTMGGNKVERKSKTLASATWTVKIEASSTDANAVKITGEWSGATDHKDTEYTKKSGGNSGATTSTTTPANPANP